MMYCPVGTFITLPFFEIEVGQLGNYVGAAAGTYPAIEPVIAIFCIKDFRKTVLCKKYQLKIQILDSCFSGQRRKNRTGAKSSSGIPTTSFH